MIPKFVLNVPNTLTLLRLLAIPVLAAVIYAGDQYNTMALILFLAIWVTDLLDGWIARHFNQITEFGKLFDPLVDKLFQFTTALMLYIVGKLPFWVPAFIFVRELLMIIGSAILLRHGKIVVQSKWYGKLSTVLFVAAFAVFFVLPADKSHLGKYIFLIPVVWSIFAYLRYYQTAVRPWLLAKLAERKKNESQR